MMTFIKRYQNILIILALVVAAFFVYSYFFAKPAAPVLTAETVPATSSVDQDLISLLLELKSIKLDDRIFSDSAFKSLQDFSQDLVPEAVGRNNPFAPLGGRQIAPAR